MLSRNATYVSVWLALLVANLFSLSAQTLSLSFEQAPLSHVLKEISHAEGLIIAFQESDVEAYVITADLNGMSVNSALQIVLDGTLLEFQQINTRQYIISVRSQNSQKTRVVAPRNTRNISGRITDAQSKTGLALAVVRVKGSSYGTHTDAKGYFVLMDIPLHLDSLEIRYFGYTSTTFGLAKSKHYEVEMERSQHQLDEISITGGSDQAVNIADAASILEINPRRVESLSGLGEPDLLRAIQFLPGIHSSDESAGGLHIRGGRPEENLILLDGITVYQAGHLFGNFSAFNPHSVKSLTVQRGGFDARYGGRVSGVIDITSRPEQMQQATAEAGINLLNANALVQVPFWDKKAALMVSIRHSNSSWLDNPFYSQLSGRVIDSLKLATQSSGTPVLDAMPDFIFTDFNAKLIVRPSDKDLVSLTAYAANDNLNYQWTDEISDTEWFSQIEENYLQNKGASLNWIRAWNPNFSQKLNVAYSSFDNRYELRQVYNLLPDDPAIGWTQRNQIQDLSLRLDYEWKTASLGNLEFGFHSTAYAVDSLLDFRGDLTESQPFRKTNWVASPYAQFKKEVLPDLSLTLGIRTNYYSGTEQYYHEPRISLAYEVNKNIQLKAVWGKFHQFLNRTELGSLAGLVEDYWTLADGDRIPVLASEHFIVGGVFQTENWLLDVELYHKETNGMITYKNFDRQQIFRPILINGGQGISKGLDILLQKKFGRYTSWMSYSLSQTTYSFPDLLAGAPFAASHDQRHQFSWVNLVELGRWDASLNWTFASGKPFTEAIGILANRPQIDVVEYSLGFGPLNGSRMQHYHRLDANLSYRYELFNGKLGGKAGIAVFNLYNRQNLQSIEYRVRLPLSKADEPSILRLEKDLLGFTPNVFLQLEF
ncbi:MAG: carboxypeptidase-like regulatory domain-containing protein [Bacteroidia bacterium]